MLKRLIAFALLAAGCASERAQEPVIVGSKNFTESVILGELVAQELESSGCSVERKFNLGGTFVCDKAIESGQLDAYVEYSGTALSAVLKLPTSTVDVDATVKHGYQKRGLIWGPNLGFNNTFAMIVRSADAQNSGLANISDLAKVSASFRPGFGYEFVEREDGWTGLQQRYGLAFAVPATTMELGLTYRALASSQVDLIAGNSTDGLIDSLRLEVLRDDKSYFPPYQAAVVRSAGFASKCAAGAKRIEAMAGTIDESAMRRMNFEVDGKKRDVATVVREFRSGRK